VQTPRRVASRVTIVSLASASKVHPMAPSRPTRRPHAQLSLYADGSSSESDVETPRQRGKPQTIRKRLSETQDKTFTEDSNPARVPLKAVNINDDSAEKRRRRRSAKNPTVDNFEAGPSSSRQDDVEDAGAHEHSRHKQALKSIIVETPIIDVPLDIRNSNYEEWMKMAMDNVRPLNFRPSHVLMSLTTENQSSKFVELCLNRLLP
jgi:condensin complex subunit 2